MEKIDNRKNAAAESTLIDKLRERAEKEYPIFDYLLGKNSNVKIFFGPDAATAKADIGSIELNENYIKGLSEDEQLFVILHEAYHIALDDVGAIGGKDPELWNFVCDARINALLKRDGFKMPKDGVDMRDALQFKNAEEMYNVFAERKAKGEPFAVEVAEEDRDGKWPKYGYIGKYGALDDHGTWEAIAKEREEAEQRAQGDERKKDRKGKGIEDERGISKANAGKREQIALRKELAGLLGKDYLDGFDKAAEQPRLTMKAELSSAYTKFAKNSGIGPIEKNAMMEKINGICAAEMAYRYYHDGLEKIHNRIYQLKNTDLQMCVEIAGARDEQKRSGK